MTASVQVDTRQFDKGVRQLADGIARNAPAQARKAAETVAERIRQATPRDTGRLIASISVIVDSDGGYGVSYGAGVDYARPVAARTGNVASGIAGIPDNFVADCQTVAEKEVARL